MDNAIIFINEILARIVDFYNSTFFSVVKFICGIYAVVVFANIVLLLFQRGLAGNIRDTLIGMNIPPELTHRKNKLRKKWKKVREKMQSSQEVFWKAAIIEADGIIDDLVKRMGYGDENAGERFAEINPKQIENIEELKKAHEIKNRIVQDENFEITKEKAEEVIGYYENFLRYYDVLQ